MRGPPTSNLGGKSLPRRSGVAPQGRAEAGGETGARAVAAAVAGERGAQPRAARGAELRGAVVELVRVAGGGRRTRGRRWRTRRRVMSPRAERRRSCRACPRPSPERPGRRARCVVGGARPAAASRQSRGPLAHASSGASDRAVASASAPRRPSPRTSARGRCSRSSLDVDPCRRRPGPATISGTRMSVSYAVRLPGGQAVLAEVEAVVGREDDVRVARDAGGAQRGTQPPDHAVDACTDRARSRNTCRRCAICVAAQRRAVAQPARGSLLGASNAPPRGSRRSAEHRSRPAARA